MKKNIDDIIAEKLQENMEVKDVVDERKSLSEEIKAKQTALKLNRVFDNNRREENTVAENLKKESLVPAHFRKGNSKHFSIYDESDARTFVYGVYMSANPDTNTGYYTLIKLKDSEEVSNNKVKRTYYIDDLHEFGNRLWFITFTSDLVLWYEGILIDNEVEIPPQKYKYMEIHPVGLEHDLFRDGLYDLESVAGSDLFNIKYGIEKKEYEADMNASAIIFDVTSRDIVLRSLFFDSASNTWKAKVVLNPTHQFLFVNISNNDGDVVFPLSNKAIGDHYKYGSLGYPKNLAKAVEYYEKEDSAESLYSIAHVFFDEPDFYDIETTKEYLRKSAEKEKVEAMIELAIIYCCQEKNYEEAEKLIDVAVSKGSDVAKFVCATFIEEGFINSNSFNDPFELYYEAALNGYKPAQYRISGVGKHNGWDKLFSKEECKAYYANSTNTMDREYCFGGMLLFGWGIGRFTALGEYYLTVSANNGNINAIRDFIFYYCCIEKEPLNTKEILGWSEKLINYSCDAVELSQLADQLFDLESGSFEIEKIAVKALQKTIDIDPQNGKAKNNLGWAYKNGRGCTADYVIAREYFEKAVELDVPTSFFNLGDLYENGLGVSKSIEKALILYNKGADLGSVKCQKRVEMLKNSPNSIMYSIYEKVTSIDDNVVQVNERTKKIEQQLDMVITFLEKDMKSWLQIERAAVKKDDNDERIGRFIEKSADYIQEKISGMDCLVRDETKRLKNIFGDVWEKLLPTSRTSLISAGILWTSCSEINNEDFDYSGVCISATSALEAELKRIFFYGFQDFLVKKYGSPDLISEDKIFEYWPDKLLSCSYWDYKNGNMNKQVGLGTGFSMGNLPYLFGKYHGEKPNKASKLVRQRMSEYLATIVKPTFKEDVIKTFYQKNNESCFVERCEQVRIEFRNPAAHTDILAKSTAGKCYSVIVGRREAYEYSANVTGLIMMLYDYLKSDDK